MSNYTTFLMFENPRRGRQARNLTGNDPKILDLKSFSEQMIFRKLSLGAPVHCQLCAVKYISFLKQLTACQYSQRYSTPRDRMNCRNEFRRERFCINTDK